MKTWQRLALLSLWLLVRPAWAEEKQLDMGKIEKLTGLHGQFDSEEGVFRVSSPRDDVPVSVGNWHVPPLMGLTSWASFACGAKAEAVLMGDIVVFEDE